MDKTTSPDGTNDVYRCDPSSPVSYTAEAFTERGLERSKALLARLDVSAEHMRGARVLDVGCGMGETAAGVRRLYGSQVVGIDPFERISSGPFGGMFEFMPVRVEELGHKYDNYFDIVQSYAVLEHIPDPVVALQKIHAVLKPGGKAFLVINLWRGASASHVTHLVFDWCHLVLEWSEIERICQEKGGRPPAPVNKLSYLEYIHHINRIGFDWVKPAWFQRKPMPVEFYGHYCAALQWYPRDELNLDFLLVSLKKSQRKTCTTNDWLWRREQVVASH